MLMRFDPFRELDRLSDEAFAGRQRPTTMPLDAYREGDRFVLAIDLPGIDPAAVDITVEKNVLTISAERQWPRTEAQEWVVSERRQGRFARQLFLGDTLDTDAIEARYDAGVLWLQIPVAERAKARKVEVQVGEGAQPRSVETTSSEATAGHAA